MKKFRAILISAGAMLAVGGILLSAAALVCSKTGKLPREALPIVTTAVACVSAFLGAFLASMLIREKGALWGLLCGGILLLCMIIVSTAMFQMTFGLSGAGKAAAVLISGSLGGILGVNRKRKVKF